MIRVIFISIGIFSRSLVLKIKLNIYEFIYVISILKKVQEGIQNPSIVSIIEIKTKKIQLLAN